MLLYNLLCNSDENLNKRRLKWDSWNYFIQKPYGGRGEPVSFCVLWTRRLKRKNVIITPIWNTNVIMSDSSAGLFSKHPAPLSSHSRSLSRIRTRPLLSVPASHLRHCSTFRLLSTWKLTTKTMPTFSAPRKVLFFGNMFFHVAMLLPFVYHQHSSQVKECDNYRVDQHFAKIDGGRELAAIFRVIFGSHILNPVVITSSHSCCCQNHKTNEPNRFLDFRFSTKVKKFVEEDHDWTVTLTQARTKL